MRLLLDEHYDPGIAEELRRRGIDAVAVSRDRPDLEGDWRHRCTVLRTDVDPMEEYGSVPKQIVPVFGWGTIPDQYGRLTPDGQDA